MGDTSHDPVDYHRTTRPHAGESIKDSGRIPGLLLVAVGLVAFVVCLVSFAEGQVGAGIAAVVVALLAAGAGLSWLAMERRRIRQAEREQVANRRRAVR